jgi:hypothetical protein
LPDDAWPSKSKAHATPLSDGDVDRASRRDARQRVGVAIAAAPPVLAVGAAPRKA